MLAAQLPAGIDFRPIRPEDEPFLEQLYASTRETELASVPWSTAEKASFLAQQFQLQHRYYQAHFTAARFEIIRHGGADIGRRYTEWRADGLALIDLSLLPAWRGQGIGTAILRAAQAEAAARAMPLNMHVEHDNPAARLYERLGFIELSGNGVYRKLRWQASAAEACHV